MINFTLILHFLQTKKTRINHVNFVLIINR